jgi:hypothetical protein
METQISVPMPTQLFLQLAEFLESKGDTRSPVTAILDAVDYWMLNADWKPELIRESTGHGYQWKNLFLPAGTEVRMQYRGEWYYAGVEGDQLLYDGSPTTPGTFANTVASSSRSAWRDLWVKRPNDTEWLAAMSLKDSSE